MLRDAKGLALAIVLTVALGALGGCVAPNQAQTEPSPSNSAAQEPSTRSEETANNPADPSKGETMEEPRNATQAQVTLNGKSFTIDLVDNETTKAFADLLPLEVKMSELNGNEKFVQLDNALHSAPTSFPTVEAGDVMLYQDNCIVVFYKTHPSSYSYTRIGKIADTTGLADAVGNGSVDASFALL